MPSILSMHYLGDREADFGKGDDRRARRSWLIKTDGRFYSELLLLADAMFTGGSGLLLPKPYLDWHPDDFTFLCKKVRAKQEKNAPLRWIADAEYDTKPFQDEEEEEEPLDRRAKITWSTTKYQKAVEKTAKRGSATNKAILNSAGDYFDPPPLKDVSRWTATVVKNVFEVPPNILQFPDRLNSDAFVIDGVSVLVNAAKIMGIQVSDKQTEGEFTFRVLTYTLEFDEDLWKGEYLQQGLYEVPDGPIQPGTTIDKVRIKDSKNKDVVSPWPLDENGKAIENPTPATAKFTDFHIYETMNFNGNLPLT